MSNFTPLTEGQPREGTMRRSRGGSEKTVFYRNQLMSNPGKWFVWKVGKHHATDTGVALKTLTGLKKLTGIDRKTLPYESCSQKQHDGTYTTYVRYVGERNEDSVTSPFGN